MRYILVILRANFLKGAGFESLWPQFAALTAFAVLIFVFSVLRFHERLAD
jgi:ABC-2 type transport system permease protein